MHIDSFVAFCGPRIPRRTLGIPVDDTPSAGIVLAEIAHEKVGYPTRAQGKRKTD